MNVELLRKIAAVIQEKPAEFDMGDWCGTSRCIAGWALKLTRTDAPEREDCEGRFSTPAEKVLGIDKVQGRRLFYVHGWPHQFRSLCATPAQAAARIEHFIATDGAE